jgi:hypothetical protein
MLTAIGTEMLIYFTNTGASSSRYRVKTEINSPLMKLAQYLPIVLTAAISRRGSLKVKPLLVSCELIEQPPLDKLRAND